METIFNTAVLMVSLTAVAASLILFGMLLSGKLGATDFRLFDKSKIRYTDGDNT